MRYPYKKDPFCYNFAVKKTVLMYKILQFKRFLSEYANSFQNLSIPGFPDLIYTRILGIFRDYKTHELWEKVIKKQSEVR